MYQAEISRKSPLLFVFLVDQSTSMEDPFGGSKSEQSKAAGLADVVNSALHNMVAKATNGENIKNYFYLSVIGYGSDVSSGLSGALSGKQMVTIEDLGKNPLRIEDRKRKVSDGAGQLVELAFKMPIWVDPLAQGSTPMRKAFQQAKNIIESWILDHPEGFPPILINVTDGEANDGDPEEIAEDIKQIQTDDGNVLVLNVHLSSSRATPIQFPSLIDGLPDDFARMLYRMSSPLPPAMLAEAKNEGFSIGDGSKGFIFNSDAVSLVQFLNIGTRPANLR
jgi:hypothetical protein